MMAAKGDRFELTIRQHVIGQEGGLHGVRQIDEAMHELTLMLVENAVYAALGQARSLLLEHVFDKLMHMGALMRQPEFYSGRLHELRVTLAVAAARLARSLTGIDLLVVADEREKIGKI